MILKDEMLEEMAMNYLEENAGKHSEVYDAMLRIEKAIGHESYMKIEDDLSFTMNFYELHGFKAGFKAGSAYYR